MRLLTHQALLSRLVNLSRSKQINERREINPKQRPKIKPINLPALKSECIPLNYHMYIYVYMSAVGQ